MEAGGTCQPFLSRRDTAGWGEVRWLVFPRQTCRVFYSVLQLQIRVGVGGNYSGWSRTTQKEQGEPHSHLGQKIGCGPTSHPGKLCSSSYRRRVNKRALSCWWRKITPRILPELNIYYKATAIKQCTFPWSCTIGKKNRRSINKSMYIRVNSFSKYTRYNEK